MLGQKVSFLEHGFWGPAKIKYCKTRVFINTQKHRFTRKTPKNDIKNDQNFDQKSFTQNFGVFLRSV